MKHLALIAALVTMAFCAGAAQAQIDWSDTKPAATGDAAAPAADAKPAAPAAFERPEQNEAMKRIDQLIGIDWGDDKAVKPEDPNAAQPAEKVDLTTALDEAQQKRLENIQKGAAEAEAMAELARKTKAGENKAAPKERSVQMFTAASGKYTQAKNSLEAFARSFKDDNIRLTLLRQYGDDYRQKAAALLVEGGNATMELQNNIGGIKAAVVLFTRARQLNEADQGWRAGFAAAENATLALMETAKATTATTGGGIGKEEETRIQAEKDREELTNPARRPDYKRTGRD